MAESKKTSGAPIIYNLFPRLLGSIAQWEEQIPSIAAMGFTHVYVNPFHHSGFSGSLYSIADYYLINKNFLKKRQDPADWQPIQQFVARCKKHGLDLIVDLVINHTAFDSPLVTEHPEWFKRNKNGTIVAPFAVDPDTGMTTVWGDLAEVNNSRSKDKEALWKYWDKLIAHFQKNGVAGFRCDAAYKVPGALWKFLIANARKRDPSVLFLAETLGCSSEETFKLKPAKFNYLFNSSKYWNFDAPWCIQQHEEYRAIAPSISFPESHDTDRLASQPPATIQNQKFRYFFAAIFSEGLLMPIGYEVGALKRIDVVAGSTADREEPRWDLREWISSVNTLKRQMSIFACEGSWEAVSPFDQDIIFLEKKSVDESQSVCICINKDWQKDRVVQYDELPESLKVKEYRYSMMPLQSDMQIHETHWPLHLNANDLGVLTTSQQEVIRE